MPPITDHRGLYAQQKRELLRLLDSCRDLARALASDTTADAVERAIGHVNRDQLRLATIGEFKRGKSTLGQAFLEDTELLPADVDIATAINTFVQYGSVEHIQSYVEGQAEPQELSRDRIRDYVTEASNPDNSRKVKLMVITTPNPRLAEGLVWIDTPGVGGLYRRHSTLTYTIVADVDVVLFVIDATKPLSVPELNFLTLRVLPHKPTLLFAMTRIDKVMDVATILEDARAKLAQAMGGPSNAVTIVPVSSRAKLEYLATQDPEDLAISNFETLESEIWRLLRDRRAHIMFGPALETAEKSLSELESALAAADRGQEDLTDQQLDETRAAAENAQQRLNELRGAHGWRTFVDDRFRALSAELREWRREEREKLERRLSEYLADPLLTGEPAKLAGAVEADVSGCLSRAHSQVFSKGDRIREALREMYELPIGPFNKTEREVSPASFRAPAVKQSGGPVTVGVGLHGASDGAWVGDRVGHFVGWVLGATLHHLTNGNFAHSSQQAVTSWFKRVGSWIGGAIGAGRALFNTATEAKAEHRKQSTEEVKQAARKYLAEQLDSVSDHVMAALENMQDHVAREFAAEIDRAQAHEEEMRGIFEKAKTASREGAAGERAHRARRRLQIEDLRHRLHQLDDVIAGRWTAEAHAD